MLFAFLAAFLRPKHLSAVVFVRLYPVVGLFYFRVLFASVSCLVHPLPISAPPGLVFFPFMDALRTYPSL